MDAIPIEINIYAAAILEVPSDKDNPHTTLRAMNRELTVVLPCFRCHLFGRHSQFDSICKLMCFIGQGFNENDHSDERRKRK